MNDFDERNKTNVLTADEFAELLIDVPVDMSDLDNDDEHVTFNLTMDEIEFIQSCAIKWCVSYGRAVERVIHNSIRNMKLTMDLFE